MVKKAKRGRKPGVKVGPYKKRTDKFIIALKKEQAKINNDWKVSDVKGNPISLEDMDKAMEYSPYMTKEPVETNIKTPKSFADCIFEIINSSMDQSTKLAAFKAMEEAAKTEVVKAY